MFHIVFVATMVAGIASYILMQEIRSFGSERNNINIAKETSEKNKHIGEMLNIESSSSNLKANSNLSNSSLLAKKAISYKIAEVSGGKSEIDIINKYEDAANEVFESNPNANINCSMLEATGRITYDECLLVHTKSYNFFHKTSNENLAYNIENEDIKKYATRIESHKYNTHTQDLSNDKKIETDSRFVNPKSVLLDKRSAKDKKSLYEDIRYNIESGNYILASAQLYNEKRGNFQKIPVVASLYEQLLDSVESATSSATAGTEEYKIRVKIQSDYAKLASNSNIMETIVAPQGSNVFKIIRDIAASYSNLEAYERTISSDGKLPSKNEFQLNLNKLNSK